MANNWFYNHWTRYFTFNEKNMENRVNILKNIEENNESAQALAKPVIWWIGGATIWGVISIGLVVWTITVYM